VAPAGDPLTILYVVSRWGEPTQTFVRREAAAARDAGHTVLALSLKAPARSDVDIPTSHLQGWQVAVGCVATLVRHPRRCFGHVWHVVRRSRLRTVAPNLAAAAIGLAATRRLPPVDWVHAHFNWVAGTAADAFATARHQPFSIFPHAFDIFDARYVDRYAGEKLRRAALVLVESEQIAVEIDARFGCRSVVQRMGVPRTTVVDQVTPRGGRLLVSVGSLLPKKGHDDLVRAVALTPDVSLRILGEGPERAALESLASQLGAADRVDLRGAVPSGEVVRHLDEAVAFCLASKPTPAGDRDGVPNVLIEAMARGTPVISTTVAGIPDLLGDDRGIVVEPGDVAHLAEAISRVTTEPDRASAMAAAALDHVRGAYTTDVNWRLLEGRIRAARSKAR
jgi:glycosyltransferase involved in cell wall biosynthesis